MSILELMNDLEIIIKVRHIQNEIRIQKMNVIIEGVVVTSHRKEIDMKECFLSSPKRKSLT